MPRPNLGTLGLAFPCGPAPRRPFRHRHHRPQARRLCRSAPFSGHAGEGVSSATPSVRCASDRPHPVSPSRVGGPSEGISFGSAKRDGPDRCWTAALGERLLIRDNRKAAPGFRGLLPRLARRTQKVPYGRSGVCAAFVSGAPRVPFRAPLAFIGSAARCSARPCRTLEHACESHRS